MRYRLIRWEWESFKTKSEADIKLIVETLDPEDREPKDSYDIGRLFWYAPEIIPEEKAVSMFVEHHIDAWKKEISWNNTLIQKLLKAELEYKEKL